uniref:Uncharacterized protein n=1 Tax=Chrysemys picta bellii TaxID=8478 RepID=A0A8C3FMG5_CHRPI
TGKTQDTCDVMAGGDVQLWDVLGMAVAQQRAQTQPHGQPDTHTDSRRLPDMPGAPPQERVHQRDVAVQADASEEEDGAVHVPIEEGFHSVSTCWPPTLPEHAARHTQPVLPRGCDVGTQCAWVAGVAVAQGQLV